MGCSASMIFMSALNLKFNSQIFGFDFNYSLLKNEHLPIHNRMFGDTNGPIKYLFPLFCYKFTKLSQYHHLATFFVDLVFDSMKGSHFSLVKCVNCTMAIHWNYMNYEAVFVQNLYINLVIWKPVKSSAFLLETISHFLLTNFLSLGSVKACEKTILWRYHLHIISSQQNKNKLILYSLHWCRPSDSVVLWFISLSLLAEWNVKTG